MIVDSAERVNSTTTRFHVVNVQTPLSTVICRLQRNGFFSDVIGGLDLQGGRMYTSLQHLCDCVNSNRGLLKYLSIQKKPSNIVAKVCRCVIKVLLGDLNVSLVMVKLFTAALQ